MEKGRLEASGEKENALLSFIGIVPVLGDGIQLGKKIKWVGRAFKPCVGNKSVQDPGERSAKICKSVFCVCRRAVDNAITWSPGYAKIFAMAEAGGNNALGIAVTVYNKATHTIHHVIPWNLGSGILEEGTGILNKYASQVNMDNVNLLMDKIASSGRWHMSNLADNGLDVSKKISNGLESINFHAKHQKYTTYVAKRLDLLYIDLVKTKGINDPQKVYDAISQLTSELCNEIRYAEKNFISINEHFFEKFSKVGLK